MIWDSLPLRTLIDVVIIIVTAVSAWVVLRQRRGLGEAGAFKSTLALLSGLGIIGTFYLVDLWMMYVLPALTSDVEAMQTMEGLHLNWSWLVVLAAVICIFYGLVGIVGSQLALIGSLKKQVAQREFAESRLRTSQERSAAILDIAPEAVISVGEDQRIEMYNQGAGRIFGHTAAEMVGQPLASLLPERFRGVHGDLIGGFARSHDQTKLMGGRGDIYGLRKDGTEFPASASITKIQIDGRWLFTVILRDITERRNYQAQLQQAQKMEAVGHLTGGVAHDFNNLLAVISGNLEILEEELDERPDLRHYTQQAAYAARRGSALTHRLLAFSRKQALRPTVVDLNNLIRDMSELLRRTLGEAIKVETVLAGGLWKCMADYAQLEGVLLNLTLNARDAMPGGGKLTIEADNAAMDDDAAQLADVSPGQYVLLAVSDTGTGMSEEVVARAFDPFFTTKEVGEGSGLGLSMVFGFVKQSGGHVKIYSEVDRGTTVKVYLPRTEIIERRAVARVEEADPVGRGELILVVEDSAEVRTLLVTLLTRLGYQTIAAGDGPTGLKMLEAHAEVALLLTDVVLPGGMSGADVGRAALESRPDLKVLYTTGYTKNAIIHDGQLDEGVELLTKPFRKATLARKVWKLLNEPI